MRCPKCGTENRADAQLCNVCGYVFKNEATEKPIAKPKISRIAVASFVLGILSLIFFLFTAIPAIVLGIVGIFKIKKSAGQLKGKGLAIAGIIIPVIFLVTFILWSFDAATIPNDYTIADFRSAPSECVRSYELLMSISEKGEHPAGAPAIGLSGKDVNTITEVCKVFKEGDYAKVTEVLEENTDGIKQAWRNGQRGRDIISELDAFPEIADLTKPDFVEAEFAYLKNLRRLVNLHRAYVRIQSCQGNEEIAIKELLKLDNVFRKLNLNARSTITKLVCIAGLANGIMTANFIVNSPQTSRELLELLAEHFEPLTNEQASLRNSLIFEYLMCKNELNKIFYKHRLRYSSFSPLKLNSTFRLYKNFCDRWIAVEENRAKIEELTVWPAIYPKLPVRFDSDGNLPWYYKVYNPIGSLLVGIMIPALDKVFQVKMKLQIHSDLLQILLNKRLGKEASLKARAYSDEYIIDIENKKIFSPGPDGEPYTEDDIKLTINPEVLGLLPK